MFLPQRRFFYFSLKYVKTQSGTFSARPEFFFLYDFFLFASWTSRKEVKNEKTNIHLTLSVSNLRNSNINLIKTNLNSIQSSVEGNGQKDSFYTFFIRKKI